MQNILELLQLCELLNKFNLIKRAIINKNNENESDPEHCYQLATVSWFMVQKNKLDLDLEKIFKYCLAHDLVEIYAGDVNAFEHTKQTKELKHKAEASALERIKNETPFFSELPKIISDYENQDDEESRFVYALDKILPVINVELNNQTYLKDTKLTKEQVIENKFPKTKKNEVVHKYFVEFIKYLDEKGDFFWPECENRDFSNKNYEI